MDDELKQVLAAISADIAALRAEEKADMTALRGEMKAGFDAAYERIHDTETRLLSAFYGWAQPMQIRVKQLPAMDDRLGLLEERITAVERKLLERGL